MNFLAHAYLADGDDAFLVGNLIADFVRGHPDPALPTAIRSGIELHRRVDSYTDAHPVTRDACRRLPRHRRRAAGVIIDMVYDHFLAREWHRYHTERLEVFTARVYRTLAAHERSLPPRLLSILPTMRANDWLASYAALENTAHALDHMALRLRRPELLTGTFAELEAQYDPLFCDFRAFFPQLIRYAQKGEDTHHGSIQ